MYEQDTELIERFARENISTMAKARGNLTIHIPIYRYRCPECEAIFTSRHGGALSG